MKKLTYLFLALLIVACSDDSSDNSNNDGGNNGGNEQSVCDEENPSKMLYRHSNGVTICACDWALIGDNGVIDGVVYEVVDESMLKLRIQNDFDVSNVVTTFISNPSMPISSCVSNSFRL